MKEKEYYAEVVTNKEEARVARNSGRKVLAIVMRCLFGSIGIDKFIMGKTKKGIESLISSIAFTILLILGIVGMASVVFFIIGAILTLIALIILVGRFIFFLVSGLKLIHIDPQDVAYIYEDM